MKLFNKKMKRSPFELQTNKTESRRNNPRRTESTSQRTQESKETTTTEPQERETIRNRNFIIDCKCGSYGHPCEIEIHEKYNFHCDCIVETGFNPEKHLIITTNHDGEHDVN
tara:strand:+ start:174 stop:509 length:336 start_codon:yes stop_codon:yes gene_type:complete